MKKKQSTKTTTTTGSVKKGPLEIKKSPKAVHPILYDTTIIKHDGQKLTFKSTLKQEKRCISFEEHTAWLPKKVAAAKTSYTDATMVGIF